MKSESELTEIRIKALDAAMEITKDYQASNKLNRIVVHAIVIEHYLVSGSLLGDEQFPKYAH